MPILARLSIAALGVLMAAGSAWAQPFGTFKWQQQPYCNVFSLSVVGESGNFTLNGTDDLCGATQKASVVGLAFPNPDGTFGFGLTIVTGPDGNALHINATISLVTLNGSWSDTNGNTGNFTFTPGAGSGGLPRPPKRASANRVSIPFSLAAGATSAPIVVPDNIPVQVMGATTTASVRGAGQVSLLSIPGADGFLLWTGLDSTAAAAITQGFSNAAGTKIVFIDFSHLVQIEVFGPAGSSQIAVRNLSTGDRAGVVTVVY